MSLKIYLKKVGVLSLLYKEKGLRKISIGIQITTYPSTSIEEPSFDGRSVLGVIRDTVEQQISILH